MIILKEINKTDTTISAKYYPEGDNKGGYLELSLDSGVVNKHIPDGKYYNETAPQHAKRRLMELANLDPVPRESKIMWY